MRKRAVACMAHTVMLSEEKCGKEEKPHSQELCNTFSCPFWRHGQWTEVSEVRPNVANIEMLFLEEYMALDIFIP